MRWPGAPFCRSAGAWSPKNYTAKFAGGPPLGTSISKGCARRITIARKAFAKSGSLEFNGQNLAQVVEVSDSWVKIPVRSEALFPDLAR